MHPQLTSQSICVQIKKDVPLLSFTSINWGRRVSSCKGCKQEKKEFTKSTRETKKKKHKQNTLCTHALSMTQSQNIEAQTHFDTCTHKCAPQRQAFASPLLSRSPRGLSRRFEWDGRSDP